MLVLSTVMSYSAVLEENYDYARKQGDFAKYINTGIIIVAVAFVMIVIFLYCLGVLDGTLPAAPPLA